MTASNKNNNSNNQTKKRLVIFVGPHKSASTTIQSFFVEHISNAYWRIPNNQTNVANTTNTANTTTTTTTTASSSSWALKDWTWPFEPYAMNRQAFSDLVVNYPTKDQYWHDTRRAELYYTLSYVWEDPMTTHMMFGDEEFDRMGDTPWSQRDSIRVLHNIVQFLQPPQLDFVVHYRTPRLEQWISIWKQTSKNGGTPYSWFVCQHYKAWEHLNSVANPLGIVDTLRRQGWNVTLIDMGGVERDGLDIAHVLACQVLHVPCTERGWIVGFQEQRLVTNHRTGDPELSPLQRKELEWLLRQRDCSYRQSLQSDPRVTIVQQDSLWDDCDYYDSKLQQMLRNSTKLLYLIQSQVDCSPEANQTNITSLRQSSKRSNIIITTSWTDRWNGRNSSALQPALNWTDVVPPLAVDQWIMNDLMRLVVIQHVLMMAMLVGTIHQLCRFLRRRNKRK